MDRREEILNRVRSINWDHKNDLDAPEIDFHKDRRRQLSNQEHQLCCWWVEGEKGVFDPLHLNLIYIVSMIQE